MTDLDKIKTPEDVEEYLNDVLSDLEASKIEKEQAIDLIGQLIFKLFETALKIANEQNEEP